LLRIALKLNGKPPAWRARPQMMRMTVTTFNVLKSLHEWEGFRPFSFFLLPVLADGGFPANINPKHFRLVAPFESDQTKWEYLQCINIGDPKDQRRYGLTKSFNSTEYGRKAVVETFENLFHRYMQHPEAKSLGPDGGPCKADTRACLGVRTSLRGDTGGLVRNMIVVGKKAMISNHCCSYQWSMQILVRRQRDASLVRASERLIRMIKKIRIRRLVKFGLGRRILEKICRPELVNADTLHEYEQKIRKYKMNVRSRTEHARF
jgi:hypothetical protein